MKQSVGGRIVSRLRNFADALESGQPLEGRFNSRTVELDLKPKQYGPREVREVRELLGVSQALFAKFLGVKVKTVQSWEQKQAVPPGMARRFMDEITLNPEMWKKRLIQSIVFKESRKAHHRQSPA